MVKCKFTWRRVVITCISKEKTCACAKKKETMDKKSKLIIIIIEHTFIYNRIIGRIPRI